MPVITVTDSVYVSVGAVEADRLDKASDWPGEIYGRSLTVNIHLGGFMGRGLRCKAAFEGAEIQLLLGGALNLIKGARTLAQHLRRKKKGGGVEAAKHYPDEASDICLVCLVPLAVSCCFFLLLLFWLYLICRYSCPEARQCKC